MKKPISAFAVKIAILILLVCAAAGLVRLMGTLASAQQTCDELEQAVLASQAENDALQYAIDHAGDDTVIAGYARQKLGLAYPDEQIFYAN